VETSISYTVTYYRMKYHLLDTAIVLISAVVLIFPSSSTALLEPITLNATQFKTLLDDTTTQWFDVIVDVRTLSEYTTGHINGSTLVESLASYNTDSQVSTPADLKGCEKSIVVPEVGRRQRYSI
jgi:hypothetical protein